MTSVEDIQKLENSFGIYFKEKNFKKAADFYAEDGVLIPPEVPMVKGKKNIEDFLRSFHDMGAVKVTADVQDVVLIDKENSIEVSLFKFYKADDTVFCSGRWMVYWKKQGDNWLMNYDILSPLTA